MNKQLRCRAYPPLSKRALRVSTSTFLAQTRTLRPGAASGTRDHTFTLKQSRFVSDGADSAGGDYRLIQHRTGSSTLPTSLRRLDSRTLPLPSVLGDSARFQRWREDWPIIEMLADFEPDHYQSRWSGPLMVGVVVVLWALATVLGSFLLMLDSVNQMLQSSACLRIAPRSLGVLEVEAVNIVIDRRRQGLRTVARLRDLRLGTSPI